MTNVSKCRTSKQLPFARRAQTYIIPQTSFLHAKAPPDVCSAGRPMPRGSRLHYWITETMLGGCRADVRPMPSCYSRGCLASRNTQTSHEKIHTGSVGFEGRTCSANRAAACGQASPTPSMMAFLGFEVPHRCLPHGAGTRPLATR